MLFRLENIDYKDILNITKLEIPENETVCILGESGSGKTTLLLLLNKMISPDNGRIYYKDTDLTEIPSVSHRRNVLMLPQNPPLFPGTIRENLLAGCRLADQKEPDDQAMEKILERLKIPQKLNDDTAKLSGGEIQRIAVGRILLMNPETLLLDEPSAALDKETEKIMLDTVLDYSSRHKNIILVSHSEAVAERFNSNLIRLAAGKAEVGI